MLLGCIADDLTGATDLALMLRRGGMHTIQVIGVPQGEIPPADAVVIALKSRTIAPGEAITQSLASARALCSQGARKIFFKYCSTFDSTDEGNIGPVIDALMTETGAAVTIACPAFPTNGRTVYQGHLFVGKQLLSDSPMRQHPLTPMTDANLVRVLQRQTARRVGLIGLEIVEKGAEELRAALRKAAEEKVSVLIVDAINDAHLHVIGEACADLVLMTGGSGVAIGLPHNFERAGALALTIQAGRLRAPPGRNLVLAGSCSEATRKQVEVAIESGMPALQLTPSALMDGSQSSASAAAWAISQPAGAPVLIYSSADPTEIERSQGQLGREQAASLIEATFAELARDLVDAGFSRLVVAGGETSGAVVGGLGVRILEIGPEIDPGVPWTASAGRPTLALALKSGNFGTADFFLKAWSVLE